MLSLPTPSPPPNSLGVPATGLTGVSVELSRVLCTTAVMRMPPIKAKPFWTLPACFVTCVFHTSESDNLHKRERAGY